MEFDSYYQVPVLAIRGTNQQDIAMVGVDRGDLATVLTAKIICGDEVKRMTINLEGGLDGNDDFLNMTSIPSLLQGGKGYDVLVGGSGPDQILGSWGGDELDGGPGDDIIFGGYGLAGEIDTVYGGRGDDYLVVHTFVSFVYGGPDDDYMVGGDGDDTLRGQGGDDILRGNDGIDILDGGADNDDLSPGNDVWADFARGGAGADTFYHPASGLGATLADFTVADQIVQGDVAYQAPPEATWEAAVQASFRNGSPQSYAYESNSAASALTVGEGLSAEFLAGDHGVTIIELDWQNMAAPVEDYFAELNEMLVESAEDDTSWAEEAALAGEVDQDAINDAALLALLAEASPSLEASDPAAEEADLLELGAALEIDPLFAEVPELSENDFFDLDLSLLEDESSLEEAPAVETTEELYVYASDAPSVSSPSSSRTWAWFRW